MSIFKRAMRVSEYLDLEGQYVDILYIIEKQNNGKNDCKAELSEGSHIDQLFEEQNGDNYKPKPLEKFTLIYRTGLIESNNYGDSYFMLIDKIHEVRFVCFPYNNPDYNKILDHLSSWKYPEIPFPAYITGYKNKSYYGKLFTVVDFVIDKDLYEKINNPKPILTDFDIFRNSIYDNVKQIFDKNIGNIENSKKDLEKMITILK
jgi:hypothetical protein